MSQPNWKCIAQLGDENPVDYGGLWVFIDTTGVYAPEVEKLFAPDDDDGSWTVYRFILEPCSWINGVLSDNKFHPDKPAWFADPGELETLAAFAGFALESLIAMFTTGSIEERALAWDLVGQYHGHINLDQYPLQLSRKEAEARYAEPRFTVQK